MRTLGVGAKLFIYLILLVSLVFIVVGLRSGSETANFLNGAKRVEGTVIYNFGEYDNEGVLMYKQQLKYLTDDGKEKTVMTRSSQNTSVKLGTKMDVFINGDEVRAGSAFVQWVLPGGLFLFGSVFLGLWIWVAIRYQNAMWARKNGQRIEVEVVAVERAGSSNGLPGWRLVCEWNDLTKGKQYRLVSNIFYGEDVQQRFVQGRKIPAWVDPENPEKKHYIEVE